MDALGWHVMFRHRDDRVIAADVAARRAWVRSVLRHGCARGLYTHGLADTHAHAGLVTSRAEAGEFARRVMLTAGGPGFEPARIVPIRDQGHLRTLVDYHLRQDAHHGTWTDPLREGTALFDLLGLRPAGLPVAHTVRAKLPRLSRADIVRHVGSSPVEEVHAALLGEAARSASLLATLQGGRPEARAARLAAVAASRELRAVEVAAALGVTTRAVQQLRARVTEADGALVRAIRLQMGLRAACAGRAVDPLTDARLM